MKKIICSLMLVAMGTLFMVNSGLAAVKLRIGLIPITDCLQGFVAQDKGFFAEEGFQAELQLMPGGAVIIPAVAGGSLEIGFSGVIPTLVSADKGFDFIMVADGAYEPDTPPWTSVIMANKNSGVNSLADLVGKKVAVNTIRQMSDLYVIEAVRRAGRDPAAITWIEIPFPQMGPALLHGQVDAANLVEPFYTLLKDSPELKDLGSNFHILRPRAIIANWIASKKWVEANPESVERFAAAIKKATDYIKANPREARVVMAKYTRLKPEVAEKIAIKLFGKSVDVEGLQWTADLLLKTGWISKKLNVQSIIYRSAR